MNISENLFTIAENYITSYTKSSQTHKTMTILDHLIYSKHPKLKYFYSQVDILDD